MIAFFDDVNGNFSLLMQRLMDYKRKHGINCLVIFLIDKNKMYCIEKVDKREDCCYMFSILNGNNVVSLACQNSRPVHHRIEENDTIVTMKENVVEELCIPIKIYTDENITVCIYCGFNQNNSNMRDVLTSFLLGFNIYEIYSYALAKYNQISKVERILKLLMIIEDNIKLNQPSMKLHSINVAFWTIEIAKKLNFRTDDFVKLYYAALFHDIGKVRIKNSIINKEGPLTEEEYEEVKHHVEYSYIIVKELIGDIYPDISLWIRCHHEKYDGTGYPYGLKGNDIPFASRIIKVADVIDVLHSPRSYKTPVSIDRIIAELKKNSGKDFDPVVVDAAIEVVNEKIVFPSNILNLKNEEVLPASISFNTQKDIFNGEGYFYFKEGQSYFKCTNNTKNVKDLLNIFSASLVVEKFNSIYEYEVDAAPIDENTYLISKIRPREGTSSISILWDLKAYMLMPEKDIEVKVVRLSADYLLFVCDSSHSFSTSSMVKMRLPFDDGEVLTLNGRIAYSYSASATSSHYKYIFINIGESTRDKLFRQIFRKQIMLRKMLNKNA